MCFIADWPQLTGFLSERKRTIRYDDVSLTLWFIYAFLHDFEIEDPL